MFHLDPKQAVLEHVVHPARPGPNALNDLAAMVADQPFDRTYSAAVTTGVAQAAEVALLIVTGLAVFGLNGGDTLLSALTTLGLVAVAEFFIGRLGMHGIAAYRRRIEQFWRVALGWTAAFAVLGALVLLFDRTGALSRSFIVGFWAAGLLALLTWRAGLHLLVARWTAEGKFRRRTVIVGGGKDAEALISSIESQARDDITLIGLFDDRNDDRSPESVASVAKLVPGREPE